MGVSLGPEAGRAPTGSVHGANTLRLRRLLIRAAGEDCG